MEHCAFLYRETWGFGWLCKAELATVVLTDLFDQLNGAGSSGIFLHHCNYVAKIPVLLHTNENTEKAIHVNAKKKMSIKDH